MYKIIEMEEYAVTRSIVLKNIITGTIDKCFDDSGIFDENFSFLKLGEEYDCKIQLFGNVVTSGGVSCKIIDKNIIIGEKEHIKIGIGYDEYYISKYIMENYNKIERFRFEYSRKDLVQVNDIVNSRMYLPV